MDKANLARIVTLLHERGAMSFLDLSCVFNVADSTLCEYIDALLYAGIIDLDDEWFVLTDWATERFTRAAEVVAANIAAEVDDGTD